MRWSACWTLVMGLGVWTSGLSGFPRPDAASLHGRVLDARTGDALQYAIVQVGPATPVATDVEGRYVIASLPPGPRFITVRRLGYFASRDSIVLRDGAAMQYDVRLQEDTVQLAGVCACDPVSVVSVELTIPPGTAPPPQSVVRRVTASRTDSVIVLASEFHHEKATTSFYATHLEAPGCLEVSVPSLATWRWRTDTTRTDHRAWDVVAILLPLRQARSLTCAAADKELR
jgi:hypothetical protein